MKQPTVPTADRLVSSIQFPNFIKSLFSYTLLSGLLLFVATPADGRIVATETYSTIWDDPDAYVGEVFTCQQPVSGGGTYESQVGVNGDATNANGAPDGNFTGKISGSDVITLSFPAMDVGGEIKITLGFSKSDGRVTCTLNGEDFIFDNPSGEKGFTSQEVTIITTQNSIQTLTIEDSGSGTIKIDGSTYTGCQDNQTGVTDNGDGSNDDGVATDNEGEENNDSNNAIDEQFLIDSLDADNPKSYVILAEKEVKLKNNIVLSGGIGAWTDQKEVEIENNSEIYSFIRSTYIDITKNSDDPSLPKIRSNAPIPVGNLPLYREANNIADFKVLKNQPDTVKITGKDFKILEIEENNIVVFTADTIYLDQLIINDADSTQIIFKKRSVLIIKSKAEIGKNVNFNPTAILGVQMWIQNGNANLNKATAFNGTLFALAGKIYVKGRSGEFPTLMTGQFIAEKVEADQHVTWKLNAIRPGLVVPTFPQPEGGKVFNVLDASLESLKDADPDPTSVVSDNVYQFRGAEVLVEIVVIEGKENLTLRVLDSLGMNDYINNGSNDLIVSGYLPIEALRVLNSYGDCINFARPVFRPIVDAGVVTSQGDKAQGSDLVRNGYSLTGAGSKIGIISDSYNQVTTNDDAGVDIGNGDLPAAGVEVILDNPNFKGTDEGRAMLQIVHDIAPDADLAFNTGFISAGAFAQAILQLRDIGCDIICDDVTYISEPFYSDGLVAQAVDQVTADGVTYVSAAGNYGTASYQGTFSPAPAPAGISGMAHDFGGGDVQQSITLKPGNYTVSLQWDNDFYSIGDGGAVIDLDIYLLDADGSTIVYAANYDNTRENLGGELGGDPLEVMDFDVVGNVPVDLNLVVVNATTGAPEVDFKYIFFRGGSNATLNEHTQGTSTIVGQANARGAIAVGAVLFKNTPPFGLDVPTPASFSSRGGATVQGQTRNKPDLCAPNGVNTTVELGGNPTIDNDEFPNFSGTSAAAPHVAAAVALIKEGRKKFENKTTSPGVAKWLLKNNALDMGVPGFDVESGAGFVQPNVAMQTFANPTPEITSYDIDPAFDPALIGTGVSSFDVTIYGRYLLPGTTEVMFGDMPLNDPTIGGTFTIINDTMAVCTFPSTFTPETRPVSFKTEAKGEMAIDGGESNTFVFNDPVKTLITIKAKTVFRKYGESNPTFSSTITGLPAGETLASTGLDQVVFSYSTPATIPLSVPGTYNLRPTLSSAPQTVTDNFDFKFVNGAVIVEKMPLVVNPVAIEITYGDQLTDVLFNYDYDGTIPDPTDLENVLITDYEVKVEGLVIADDFTLFNSLQEALALVDGLSELALVDILEAMEGLALVDVSDLLDALALVDNTLSDDEALALVDALDLSEGLALVDGNKMTSILDGFSNYTGTPITDGASLKTAITSALGVNNDDDALALVDNLTLEDGIALVDNQELALVDVGALDGNADGLALVDATGEPFGLALVDANNEALALVDGFPSLALVDGIALDNALALVDELALVDDIPLKNILSALPELALVDKTLLEDALALVDGFGKEGIALVDGVDLDNGLALVDGTKLLDVLDLGNTDAALALVDGTSITNATDFELALVDAGLTQNEALALVDNLTVGESLALVDELALVDVNELALVDVGDLINELALVDRAGTLLELALVDQSELALVDNLGALALVDGNNLVNELALVDGGALVNKSGMISDERLADDDGNSQSQSIDDLDPQALINGLEKNAALALVDAVAVLRGPFLTDALGLDNEVALVDQLPIKNAISFGDGEQPISNSTTLGIGLALVDGLAPALALVDGSSQPIANGIGLGGGVALVDANDPENLTSPLDEALALVDGTTEITELLPVNILSGYDVGCHWIVPGTFFTDNFEVTYLPGKVKINPKDLTIIVDDKTITPGSALPEFTSTITGLVDGDNLVVEYTVDPVYEGGAGMYNIIATVTDPNYNITIDNGQLNVQCETVNPTFVYCPSDIISNDALVEVPTPVAIDNASSALGNALDFDGTDDYVRINNPVISISTELTMEAWIYIDGDQFGSNTWRNIMRKSTGYGMAVSKDYRGPDNIPVPGFRLRYWSEGGGLNTPYSSSTLPVDEWVHIAVTVDEVKTKFYISGIEVGTTEVDGAGPANEIPLFAGPLYLGQQGNSIFNFWDGKMDEVRIWNDARTAQEIADNMIHHLTGSEPNLEAYYDFNQGIPGGDNSNELTLIDRSNNNNNGLLTDFTLTGETGNWIRGGSGPFANTLDFDGSNDYVNMGDVLDMGTSDFTIEAWIYIDDATTQNTIINKGLSGFANPPQAGYGITTGYYVTPGGGPTLTNLDAIEFRVGHSDQSFTRTQVPSSGLSLNSWHHIAGTRNGTEVKLYLDGVNIASETTLNATGTPTVFNVDNNAVFGVGAFVRPSGGIDGYVDGKIDEVRVWNTARTQTEIATKMNIPLIAANEPDLAAYYDFNQGTPGGDNTSQILLQDRSGNFINGALINFAKTGDSGNFVERSANGLTITNDYNGTADASDTYPCGTTTTVTWTATDACGNTTTCTTDVTVESDVQAITKNITLSLDVNGSASITAEDIDNGSYSDCSAVTLDIDQTDFSCIDITSSIPVTTVINSDQTWRENEDVIQFEAAIDGPEVDYWNGITLDASLDDSWSLTPVIGNNGGNPDIIPGTSDLLCGNNVRVFRKTFNLNNAQDLKATFLASVDNQIQIFVNRTEIAHEGNRVAGNYELPFHRVILDENNTNHNGGADNDKFDRITSMAPSQIFQDGLNEIIVAVNNYNDAGFFSLQVTIEENVSNTTIPVTLTVTDVDNPSNFQSALAYVTVEDNTAPTFTCTSPITVSNDPGQCDAAIAITAPIVSDGCDLIGNALDFDGTDDSVVLPNESNFDITAEITIEAWIKVDGSFDKPWEAIVTKGENAWRLHRFAETNTVAFSANGLTTTQDLDATTNVADGQWHHIAGVYDGNLKSIYIDGVLEKFAGNTGSIGVNDSPVLIGENAVQTGRFFGGKIDEVRIWNVARTEQQIQESRNSRLTGLESGLVAYYNFESGTAEANNSGLAMLQDRSPNGNDGALQNFALDGAASNWVQGVDVSLTNDFNYSSDASDTYPIGVSTVTWTSIDVEGNITQCNFDVTVEDNTAPTITCPSDINQNDDGSNVVSGILPSASDNCDIVLQTWAFTGATVRSSDNTGINDASGQVFDVGTTTITYYVEDASGNSDDCSFTVTINPLNCSSQGDLTNCVDVAFEGGVITNEIYTTAGATQVVSTQQVGQIAQWQAFNISSPIEDLDSILIDLSWPPSYVNFSPLTVTIYEGIGTGGNVVDEVILPSDFVDPTGTDMVKFVGNKYLAAGDYTLSIFPNNTSENQFNWRSRNFQTGDLPADPGFNNRFTRLITAYGTSCFREIDVPQPDARGFGPEGTSFLFDGVDDYATTRNPSIPAGSPVIPTGVSDSYTVSVWAKELNGSSILHNIISQGRNFYIGQSSLGNGNVIRIGDSWINTGIPYPQDNLWHNYTVVRDVDNNDTYLYLDGTLVANRGGLILPPIVTDNRPNDFIIGAQWSTGERFGGQIDEIRIYNTALSAGEVACNINSDLSGGEPANMVGYYYFEDPEANSNYLDITDKSSSGLHAPLVNVVNPAASWVPSLNVQGRWDLAGGDLNIIFSPQVMNLEDIPSEIRWSITDLDTDATCTSNLSVVAPTIGACPPDFTLDLIDLGSPAELEASFDDNGDIRFDITGALPFAGRFVNDVYNTSCDCPAGYAVVGFEGEVGNVIDGFKLICAKVNAGGSFDPTDYITCYSGVPGIPANSFGPILTDYQSATDPKAMVGFVVTTILSDINGLRYHYGLQGISKTTASILLNESTDLNTTLTSSAVGDGTGPLDSPETIYAPPGSVIVGMNVNQSDWSNSVVFKYQPLEDIITPIHIVPVDPATPIHSVSLDRTTYDNSDCGNSYVVSMTANCVQDMCSFQVDVTCPIGGRTTTQKAYLESQFEISLAPNPSNGLVAIGLKGLIQDTEMIVMDFTGRQVHRESVAAKTSKVYINVSERKYQNGVYIVAFRINDDLVTKKLVVLK